MPDIPMPISNTAETNINQNSNPKEIYTKKRILSDAFFST